MLKKLFFIPLLLSASLCCAAPPQQDNPDYAIENALPEEKLVDGQYEAAGDWADSREVNTVQVSELARKMTQAEKQKNAREYDSFGGGITIIAMCIVIGALVILSLLFYLFGGISSWFVNHKKKKVHERKQTNPAVEKDDDHAPAETYAAIAAALAQHFSADHDMEDTILTIRKLRKAYSPWNSKIYNMRPAPEVPHHPVKIGK